MARLVTGGLLASRAAHLLSSLARVVPADCDAFVAAGALPPLVDAVSLPLRLFKQGGVAELGGGHWGLFAAAQSAAALLATIAELPALGAALREAGAPLAVAAHLARLWSPDVTRPRPPHYPSDRDVYFQDIKGTPVLLLAALASEGAEASEAGAEALGRFLGLKDPAGPVTADAMAQMLPSIVSLLAREAGAGGGGEAGVGGGARRQGAFALAALLEAAPVHRRAVLDSGSLPPLVACLRGADDAAAALAARALRLLGSNEPAFVDPILAAGALGPVLALLGRPHSGARKEAALALSQLMHSESCRPWAEALEGGAARLLAACMTSSDGVVVGAGLIGLIAFRLRASDVNDDAFTALFVDQVLEGCPPPRLVALLGQPHPGPVAANLPALVGLISGSMRLHGALVSAGLPRALVAGLLPGQGGAPPLLHEAAGDALTTLARLLCGLETVRAARDVVAAGGIGVLVAALPSAGDAGDGAAGSLMGITRQGEHRAAIMAAGAVPPLMSALAGATGQTRRVACAARALLNLASSDASVAAAAAAAGLSAARLEGLAL